MSHLFHRPRRPSTGAAVILGMLFTTAFVVVLWFVFLATTHRNEPHTFAIVGLSAYMLGMVIASARVVIVEDGLWSLVVWLVLDVATFLGGFSHLYWADGNTVNFNHPLTHLDAIYFALGTFSTAGTGAIQAISEGSRSIQSLQMVIGLVFVLVVIGSAVNRYTSQGQKPTTGTNAGKSG